MYPYLKKHCIDSQILLDQVMYNNNNNDNDNKEKQAKYLAKPKSWPTLVADLFCVYDCFRNKISQATSCNSGYKYTSYFVCDIL